MKIQKCMQKRNHEWSEATKTRIAAALGMSALVSLTACTKSSVSEGAVETAPSPSISNKIVDVSPNNTISDESSQKVATEAAIYAKTGTSTDTTFSSSSALSSSSEEDPGPTAGVPYYDYEQEQQQ